MKDLRILQSRHCPGFNRISPLDSREGGNDGRECESNFAKALQGDDFKGLFRTLPTVVNLQTPKLITLTLTLSHRGLTGVGIGSGRAYMRITFPRQGLRGVGIHPHPNPLPEGEGVCCLEFVADYNFACPCEPVEGEGTLALHS